MLTGKVKIYKVKIFWFENCYMGNEGNCNNLGYVHVIRNVALQHIFDPEELLIPWKPQVLCLLYLHIDTIRGSISIK